MKPLIVGLTLILLTGCGTLQPPKTINNNAGGAAKQSRQTLTPVKWQAPHQTGTVQRNLTRVFNTPELKRLIRTALRNNPNLGQSALSLKEQGLLAHQTYAAQLPTLNLDGSRTQTGAGGNTSAKSYQIGFSSHWEIDLWGKLADQTRAATLDHQAAQADYQAARNSLAAQVARHWLSLAAQQQILRLEQQRLTNLQKLERSETLRFKSGLDTSNAAQLASTRQNTASIRSSIATRRETLQQTERALNILLGQPPATRVKTSAHLPQIRIPVTSVPTLVMGARPDLQAAFSRIQAADTRTQVAYKQLLPSISLSPVINRNSTRLSDLLSGNSAWQLLANLSGNVFDGGRNRINISQQQSAAQRAALAYRETLLNALQEVENALSQEATYKQQAVFLSRASRQAQISVTHYRRQYAQGLASLNDLLSAEQGVIDTRINLLETQRSQLENRIQLALALGMGV